MVSGRYAYPAEKLDSARRALIAPSTGARSGLQEALDDSLAGVNSLKAEDLDEAAGLWVGQIRKQDPGSIDSLEGNDKISFTEAVTQLAGWLQQRFESS